MIETPQDMKKLINDLAGATMTQSTLAVLFEAGLVEQLREPRTVDELVPSCPWLGAARIERCLAVAAANGVIAIDGTKYRLAPGVMPFAQPGMRAAMLGELRAPLLQAVAFFDSVARKQPSTGWEHTDPAILQTQGDSSAQLAPILKMMIIPQLGDLAERLARSGSRFLDVGAGVGSLSIAMCRVWPELRVVGVDSNEVSMSIAKDQVVRAGLAERIELRVVEIETLADEAAFELAWLPSFFIAPSVVPRAVARVHAALRPGGWIVFAALGGGVGKDGALGALLADLWGGDQLPAAQAEAVVSGAGFTNVRALPGPAGASMIVGQRA